MGDDKTETDGGATTNQITDIGSGGGGGPSVDTPSGGISDDPYNQDSEQSRRGVLKAAAAALGIGGAAVGVADVATNESLLGLGTGSSGTEGAAADEQNTDEYTIPDGLGHYREKLEGTEPVDEASKGFGGESKLTTDEISQLLEGETNLQEELQFLVENTETDYIHSATAEYLKQKENTENIILPNKTFASIPGANKQITEFILIQNSEIQGVHGINGQYNGQNLKYTTQNGGEQLFQNLYNPDKAASTVPEDLQGIQEKAENLQDDIGGEATDEEVERFKQMMYDAASGAIPGVNREDANLRFSSIEAGMTLYRAKFGDGDGKLVREISQEYNNIENPGNYDTIAVEYDGGWELTPGEDPGDSLAG